jgi:hypothetical protein
MDDNVAVISPSRVNRYAILAGEKNGNDVGTGNGNIRVIDNNDRERGTT